MNDKLLTNSLLSNWRTQKDLFKDLDSLFGDLFEARGNGMTAQSSSYEVKSDDEGHALQMPVPGLKKEQVSVTVSENTLSIKAEANGSSWTKAIDKQFTLPKDTDFSSISATVEDGLLTVTVPRKAPAQPKEIEIL